jgi:hypothetical protein
MAAHPACALPTDRPSIVGAARSHAQSGTEMQRVVGLILLIATSPPDAAEAGKQIYEDSNNGDYLRMDGLAIHLLAVNPTEGDKTAVAVLTSGNCGVRRCSRRPRG